MNPDSPACDALAARIEAMHDPNANPYRTSHADSLLIAARWRDELAEMRSGHVAAVDPYNLAGSA